MNLRLPGRDGTLLSYAVGSASTFQPPEAEFCSRIAYSAAHVVADPLAENTPISPAALDWEATLAYRHYLWSLGLGVAEAMDTAQRGMGLGWTQTQELIRLSLAEARAVGGRIACGAGTDHLEPESARSLRDIENAYEDQCSFVERGGGQVVLMASRELARLARSPQDYIRVYSTVLRQLSKPAILHWLGDMFDPLLAGYWGHEDLDPAMDVCLEIIADNVGKVEGVKLSVLDPAMEVTLRRRLPEGVRMYTGDDFNYLDLIRGDDQGYSDALLGAFDAIAPAASAALQALDTDDIARYEQILIPTVPLSRHIFQAPTYFYKAGVVFMAYLNGHQNHFRMVAGMESARSVVHLAEVFVLADRAHLLRDPELASSRMARFLALAGVC